jgi:hypothetical protein
VTAATINQPNLLSSLQSQHSQTHHALAFCSALQPKVKLLIGGDFQDSATDKWVNVTNPVSTLTATATQIIPSGAHASSGSHISSSDTLKRLYCSVTVCQQSHFLSLGLSDTSFQAS